MSHHQNNPNCSEACLTANTQNTQLSSGSKTQLGESISSQNAVMTALTGRTVLLHTDFADCYAAHVQAFCNEIAPVGQRETILTQCLADIAWRIERIASFEMAIYAKGRAVLANNHQDEPDSIRPQLIELDIYQTYERELRNLALQESRLRRQRDRDNAELRALQAERKSLAEKELEPAALGFVFSMPSSKASSRNAKPNKPAAMPPNPPRTLPSSAPTRHNHRKPHLVIPHRQRSPEPIC